MCIYELVASFAIGPHLLEYLAQTQHVNHEPPTAWNTLLSNKLWRGDAFEHREHLLGVREAKTSVAQRCVYPACEIFGSDRHLRMGTLFDTGTGHRH